MCDGHLLKGQGRLRWMKWAEICVLACHHVIRRSYGSSPVVMLIEDSAARMLALSDQQEEAGDARAGVMAWHWMFVPCILEQGRPLGGPVWVAVVLLVAAAPSLGLDGNNAHIAQAGYLAIS